MLRTKPDTGTAHTAGEWTVSRSKMATDGAFDYAISAADAPVIAEAFGRDAKGGWPNAEANARLIAAAPDMFEALRDVVTFAALYKGKMEDTLGDEALAALGETALAVLTRAEGRKP